MSPASKSILRFILRTLAIVGIGIAVPVVWYILTDPFKVLRHYDTYFPDPKEHPVRIGMNKGLATLSNFTDRRNEGRVYDSFIFGASISCYYDAATWASLIEGEMQDSVTEGKPVAVHPYHFDSSGESLMSMARKIRYLDREGVAIDHALVVLDPMLMASEAAEGAPYIDPPRLHDSFFETVRYHYTFFRAATSADFFKSFIPSSVHHRVVENGHNPLFEPQPIVYDSITNQESIPLWDSLIRADSPQFYLEHPLKPSSKSFVEAPPCLSGERLAALKSISEIFARQNTDCHIIIGPNRSKVIINKPDLLVLEKLFTRDRVHDYGRSHAFLLENDTMLYDNIHYRFPMAEIMMRDIYSSH